MLFPISARWIAQLAASAATEADRRALADVCLEAGRQAMTRSAPATAERLFARVVTLSPENHDAWAQLGLVHLMDNRFAESADALGRAITLGPPDAVALGGLALAELKLNRLDGARTHAAAALAVDPNERLALAVKAALGG